MSVQVYCFDWAIYAKRVMPAFARWLIEGDEQPVYQLFAKTRCALEEQYLPDPMQRLGIWPRAKSFVAAIPRGPHSRKEYAKLCSATQFTALSDRYLHHYSPHLYQNSSALRATWGAIVETYCLPRLPEGGAEEEFAGLAYESAIEQEAIRGELISLLQDAGLPELAHEVSEQAPGVERFEWEPLDEDASPSDPDDAHIISSLATPPASELVEDAEIDIYADDEEEIRKPSGVLIGRHPNTLHLRGWLAGYTVRSMALFEYLALGRRRMPFGYEPGESFGGYCGYLTPTEVEQLASSLLQAQPPDQSQAEADYQRFCQQQMEATLPLPDEVLPTYAHEFLQAVRRAALYNLGLICSVD